MTNRQQPLKQQHVFLLSHQDATGCRPRGFPSTEKLSLLKTMACLHVCIQMCVGECVGGRVCQRRWMWLDVSVKSSPQQNCILSKLKPNNHMVNQIVRMFEYNQLEKLKCSQLWRWSNRSWESEQLSWQRETFKMEKLGVRCCNRSETTTIHAQFRLSESCN